MSAKFEEFLLASQSCDEAMEFCQERGFNFAKCYKECPDPFWLTYLYRKLLAHPGSPLGNTLFYPSVGYLVGVADGFLDGISPDNPYSPDAYARAAAIIRNCMPADYFVKCREYFDE